MSAPGHVITSVFPGMSFALALCCCCVSSVYAEDGAEKFHVGDQFTFQETNDLTKAPDPDISVTITDVSDQSVTASLTSTAGGMTIKEYDPRLNAIQSGGMRFNPDNAAGMPDGAKPGTTWRRSFDWQDTDRGIRGKGITTGGCDDDEPVTVPAGTYDALKCEVVTMYHDVNGGPVLVEVDTAFWYALQVGFFVKLSETTKIRGEISGKKTQELSDYSPQSP